MNARIPTLLRFAALTLLAFSTDAWAADQRGARDSTPVSVTVDAAGLDLSSPSGARRLHRQIVAAAETACGESPRGYKGVERRKYETQHVRPCVAEAVRAALDEVAAITGRDIEQVAGVGQSGGRVSAAR